MKIFFTYHIHIYTITYHIHITLLRVIYTNNHEHIGEYSVRKPEAINKFFSRTEKIGHN